MRYLKIIDDIIYIVSDKIANRRKKVNKIFEYLRTVLFHRFSSCFGQSKVMEIFGIKIKYIDKGGAMRMIREIFTREVYYFSSSSGAPRIIDAGGNIGIATLYFKSLYPNACIDIFEPNVEACEIIRENLKANNLEGVLVHEAAVSDEGIEFLDLFYYGELAGNTGSSLLEEPTGGKIKKNKSDQQSIVVNNVRLADFIRTLATVDLLKLDVEGMETRIMGDLCKTGQIEKIKEIIMEFHYDDKNYKTNDLSKMVELLRLNGFHLRLSRAVESENLYLSKYKNHTHYLIFAYRSA